MPGHEKMLSTFARVRSQGSARLSALSAGLLLAMAGCVADSPDSGGKERPTSDTQLRSSKTSLSRASSCGDLLEKIQDDAIAKLDLSVARAKQNWEQESKGSSGGGTDFGGASESDDAPRRPQPGPVFDAGVAVGAPIAATTPTTSAPAPNPAPPGALIGGGVGGVTGGGAFAGAGGTAAGTSNTTSQGTAPGAPVLGGGAERDPSGEEGKPVDSGDPIGTSGTNTQVKDVDEADFMKLVDSGRGLFLLHGNSLRKLKSFPPEQLSLEPPELKIEGSPSELFVTDEGRAVIFSSVWGYSNFGGVLVDGAKPVEPCAFGPCAGGSYVGDGQLIKITVADVSGDKLTAVRELYYQGSYVSSRRYDQIVRVIVQSENSFDNLFSPEVDGYDPWGRPYEPEVIDEQLEQWRDRIATSVRNTTLADWIPAAKELKDGKLVDIAPGCDSYFVPQPGFANSGLVQVLSLDVSKNDSELGGVSVVGRASTVYSNVDRLVLAQPDYRWDNDGRGDFGFIDEQRTTLHTFALDAAKTTYLASGWVFGHLPLNNQQFGLDVTGEHALRVATTGQKRAHPNAKLGSPEFWQTETQNLVSVLHEEGETLKVVGESDPLGHAGESVQSARFVGDRGYVVTFRQTDPLIVLDVSDDKEPVVLGEIEIPGFSQYMHPLDDDHLITFGRSGNGGSQLQLFDVSDPLKIPAPKTLDFGGGSNSEIANNHKAFTYYAPLGLLALPVSGSRQANGIYSYMSALRVIHVDAQKGFELLGSIDHSGFATNQNGCFSCGPSGCQSFCGNAGPDVRRGAIVESSTATYVYAIGYGGVTVNDLKDLATPLGKVALPVPTEGNGPWYGGGFVGGGIRPGGFATPSGFGGISPTPVAVSVPVAPPVLIPTPVQDASVVPVTPPPAPAQDAGVASADAG